jgi:hypothetical protein
VQFNSKQERSDGMKKSYQSPELTVYGKATDLTEAAGGADRSDQSDWSMMPADHGSMDLVRYN